MTIRSADECEMSRSCQSGTFSKPTTAAARTTARGPRCARRPSGCACAASPTSPSCPAANGSSTSRTSVRARWRISVAKRSSDVAQSASARSSSACRSRAITCVETGSGSSPSRSQAMRSTSGSIAAYVPTVPESWPTRHASSARSSRVRARSSSNAQPASFQPNVVGSAWMPCERPMQIVPRCSSARRTTAASARVEAAQDQRSGIAELQRERGVDDVGGGEAVVHPAALRAELLGDGVDERGEVVIGRLLDLGDALGRRHGRRVRGSLRHRRAGTAPTSAQPSSAASSTSSQRASLPSSDQIRLISGRE